MNLFYLVRVGKKDEVRSVDASTFTERVRKMRALENKRSQAVKNRHLMGASPIIRKRIFFRDID